MMFRSIFAAAVLLASQNAYAATVGGFEIDPSKGVATFSNPTGTYSTSSGPNYTTLYSFGNSWGGIYVQSVQGGSYSGRRLNFLGTTGHDVSIQANFTAPIVNQAGHDFYIFESGDANSATPPNGDTDWVAAKLTSGGSWVDLDLLGFLTSTEVGGPVTTAYGVYVFGLDFSDLGVAPGASLTSLIFGNSTTGLDGVRDPDIVYGAAAATSEVPLPAALPLFVAGLGALGIFARRKKRAPQV